MSAGDSYPKLMVYKAEDFRTPYLQMQFGIRGVFFQDGSTWSVPYDHSAGTEPFDRELEKSADWNCSEASAMNPARSEQIVFERQRPQTDDSDAEHNSIPQLHFRCRLEGPKAICQMPESRRSKH